MSIYLLCFKSYKQFFLWSGTTCRLTIKSELARPRPFSTTMWCQKQRRSRVGRLYNFFDHQATVLDHTHPPRTAQLSHRAHIKPQTGSDSGWHAASTVGSSTGQQCSLMDSRDNSDFYSCSAVPGWLFRCSEDLCAPEVDHTYPKQSFYQLRE